MDDQSANQETKKKDKTILIVEDDSVLSKMYTQKLASEGFSILNAADGEEALQIVKKENVDFILCDIMMPKVSGLEFLENLRKTDKGKNITVVAWSNLADEEEKQKALSLGAKEFLHKGGLSLEQVAETVKKYV